MADPNLTLAVAALDAAIANLMVQREALKRALAMETPAAPEPTTKDGTCLHPASQRKAVETMGATPVVFCGLCGDDVTGVPDA